MSKTGKGAAARGASARAKGRRPRRAPLPLSPQDALAMLASAIGYCQQAGLRVSAFNAVAPTGDNVLRLYIPGAHYVLTDDGAGAAFRIGNLPEVNAAGATAAAQ